MTSTLPPLIQAFSGAIGSASATILTYPLDLVTTRVQLDPPTPTRKRTGIRRAIYLLRYIIQRDGITSLYRGAWTDTGATILSNFLYFYIYSYLRALSTRRLITLRTPSRPGNLSVHKPSMAEELILGFIAGVLSRAVSTPLSMITLQLQAQDTADEDSDDEGHTVEPLKKGNVATAARGIYKVHGFFGFWRGFQTTTLLSLNPSITLTFFQLFRRLLSLVERSQPLALKASARTETGITNPTPAEAFVGAAISNSIAVTVLYPLILAKTRLQASSASSLQEVMRDAYNGVDTFSHKRHMPQKATVGGRGLYQGLEVQILKGFLNQGVTLFVKGRIEEMIVNAYLRRRRGRT